MLDTTTLLQFSETLLAREQVHLEGVTFLKEKSLELRGWVAQALEVFHDAMAQGGAGHLCVELTEVSQDRKDFNAWQFALRRGRWSGVVVCKLPSSLRCVGPFREGDKEGPCGRAELHDIEESKALLEDFLFRFVQTAFDPDKQFRKTRAPRQGL